MWVTRAIAIGLVCVSGCASDDDWRVRPPGGTGGGNGAGGDAGAADAGGVDGATGELSGLICIVEDLRVPDACPAVAARGGVDVRRTDDGAEDVSDSAGRFTLPADGTSVLVDVGDGATALMPSRVRLPVGGAVAHAPVPRLVDWSDVIDATDAAPADGSGAIVAYARDGDAPAPGVVFDAIPGATIEPLYDDGAALAWRRGGGTGIAGVALLLDVPPGTYTLVGMTSDRRTVTLAGVSVGADRVTFVRGALAP